MDLNLTPQMMAQTGLPASLKATLDANANSEAVSASPLRSRHEGHMSLVITDGAGKQPLANVNIRVTGESDGSPSEGLAEVLKKFIDAASLMSHSTQVGQPTR